MKTILINGIIGWDLSAADVRKSIIEAQGDDLTIEINSPGGLVTDGIAIYNAIKNAPGQKTTKRYPKPNNSSTVSPLKLF